MSFVEFDSNNTLIKTILEEIDVITSKLDRRADQIINTYSPTKVNSRLRAMSPEIKNLRNRTIDLIKDGESVLNRMSKFQTDDRSKYSVKDWMKNLNNENDLRRVLVELRNKLAEHIEFLKSYYPTTSYQEQYVYPPANRDKSRDTVKRNINIKRKGSPPARSPQMGLRNGANNNTQERFAKVEGQLEDILNRLNQINRPPLLPPSPGPHQVNILRPRN